MKNMEIQHGGHPFVGTNDAPPAPPFVLEATRKLAVNHIKRYQEVFSRVSTAQRSDSLAIAKRRYTTTDKETCVLRTIVKGKLTLELNDLLGSVSRLEETLVAKRKRVRIVQGILAAGLHFMLRNMVPHYLPPWICFLYYPIALYKIVKFENSISRTNRAREAFERILGSVQGERQLQQGDIDYVIGPEWDTVSWKEFAGSVYFS